MAISIGKYLAFSLVICNVFLPFCLCQQQSLIPLFGTKTSYGLSQEAFRREKGADNVNWPDITDPADCKVVHTSWFTRHGSRNPSDAAEMNDLFKKIEDSGTDLSKIGLKDWSNPFAVAEDSELNDVGKRELFGMGDALGKKYKDLFTQPSSSGISIRDRVIIMSSYKSRTKDSSYAFIRGLKNNSIPVEEDFNTVNDSVIRFYDFCNKTIHLEEDEDALLHQFYEFQKRPAYQKVIQNVQNKLCVGCKSDFKLSTDEMVTIYEQCAYERQNAPTSPWCDLFTEEDIRTLAYSIDIEKWLENGPVHDVLWQSSCVILQDMFEKADQMLDKGYPTAVLRFGHSEGIASVYTLLGLFQDSPPPRPDNMNLDRKRQWRTSLIRPMAANLEFALVDCSGAPNLNAENVKVRVRVNGRPVQLPMCKEGELCSYQDFKNHFTSKSYFCKFDEICRYEAPASTTIPSGSFTPVASTVLLLFSVIRSFV